MTITNASHVQRLDAAGEFKAEMPLTDPQTATALPGRVYQHFQEGQGFAFAGSIEERVRTPVDTLLIRGDSLLVELLYANTLIGKEYTNTAVDDIIDDLLDGTGWTRLGTVSDLVTVRFDGESVLRAALLVLDQAGVHCRAVVDDASGTLLRRLEIGSFGQPSGVVCSNGAAGDLAIADYGLAAIPEGEFSIEDATTEVWNWVLPLGAGEGDTQLTLVQQTRLPNLIPTNPSFEDDLTGWTASSGVTVDKTRAVHGRQSAIITTTSADKEISRILTAGVAAGATYRTYVWTYKQDSGGQDNLIVEFRTSGGSVISSTTVSNTETGRWVPLDTGNLVAPATTAQIRIRMQNDRPDGHTCNFDLPYVWRVAADVGLRYDILTAVTTPTALFPRLNWYISDPGSITAYGQRQRAFVAKDIVPLAPTKPAYQVAANALYDLAAAQLDRWREMQTGYRLAVYGLDPAVLPGDLIRLRYKGMAMRAGEPYMYVDVDEDLYVLERRTEYADAVKDTLLVSNLDRQLQNDDEVVIGKLEDTVRAFRTHVQTSVGVWAESLGPEEVDEFNSFMLNARVPDNVVQLLRLLITITPRFIRSPVSVSEAGGQQTSSGGTSHTHTISGQSAASGGSSSPTSNSGPHKHAFGLLGQIVGPTPDFQREVFINKETSGTVLYILRTDDITTPAQNLNTANDSPGHTHTVSVPNHTHSVSGATTSANTTHTHQISNHTHDLAFGIFEGTAAVDIDIIIDGVNRTSALSGPFSAQTTVDITRYFLDDDSLVVQGDHDIELTSSQLGRIEARLEWVVAVAALAQ